MNNKGFTTVEVIVSFALVVIIMASMTTMLVAYRDSINIEETKTKMLEFKNSFTYMVYQDIIYDHVTSIQPCGSAPRCYYNKKTCDYEWGDKSNTTVYSIVPNIDKEEDCVRPPEESPCVPNPNIDDIGSTESTGICVQFKGSNNVLNTLKVERDVVVIGKEGDQQRRVYLNYNGIRMMLPDSDLNKYVTETDSHGNKTEVEKSTAQINDFVLQRDDLNRVYSLTIPFSHNKIHYYDNIKIVVAE